MEEPAIPTRSADGPSVRASANGPLVVSGDVPLYRRRAVHSEHGEPLAWETTERVEAAPRYALCRCGASDRKPFCDGTHGRIGFEAADDAAGTYDARAKVLGGSGITVRDDRSICVHAGFCVTRIANVWGQVAATEESTVRAQIISMIEHCPSGALTYRFDGRDADTEDLLPRAISVIDDGPLWVTGGIEVSTDNGPIESRNRVTLCRCGSSGNKPLCDGSHKEAGFRDASPA